MRYRLDFTPPSVLEPYRGTRAVAKTFRASGAAGELARLGVDLHLLAFLDEERHANLKTGLERGRLGHAADAVSPRTPGSVWDTVSSTCGGNWMAIGLPLYLRICTRRLSTSSSRSSPTVSPLSVSVSKLS